LVPVRAVFEMLGFEVDWNETFRIVTLTSDDYVVHIRIGIRGFTTNYRSYSFEVPAQIIDGRTMVPIRAVLESVGYRVAWNENTQTVIAHSRSFLHSNVSDVDFNVEYHSWCGFIFSQNLIIRSVEELLEVTENQIFSNIIYPDPMINNYFLDITSEFDSDFFAGKMLILTTRYTSTGMASTEISGVSIDKDDILTVHIVEILPDSEVFTMDVGFHFYILSVPQIKNAIMFSDTGWQ